MREERIMREEQTMREERIMREEQALSQALMVCGGCGRHIQRSGAAHQQTECPFCGAEVPSALQEQRPVQRPVQRSDQRSDQRPRGFQRGPSAELASAPPRRGRVAAGLLIAGIGLNTTGCPAPAYGLPVEEIDYWVLPGADRAAPRGEDVVGGADRGAEESRRSERDQGVDVDSGPPRSPEG